MGQRPRRCGRAGLHTPQETSYSRRSVAATRLCCAWCLRVWCFSAPPSPVVLASDVQSCGPTVASSCRRARTTTSILGRGVGRLVALCTILRTAVRLPALVAHLLRVRARSSPLVQHAAQPPRCARATQGSEPLLCTQQARRGSSVLSHAFTCAALLGGVATLEQVSAPATLAVAQHARRDARGGNPDGRRPEAARSRRAGQRWRCCRRQLNALFVAVLLRARRLLLRRIHRLVPPRLHPLSPVWPLNLQQAAPLLHQHPQI